MKFFDKLNEINSKSSKPMRKKDWLMFTAFVIGSLAAILYGQYLVEETKQFHPVPLTDDEIKKIGNSDLRAIVIYPYFTQVAYKPGGFYDYYNGKCNSCTTVSLRPLGINATYNTGKNGFETLQKLNYPFITDMTVDRHPEILKDYDVIVLLHNEYMTKTEFDAILNHKNVFYLYPNSMYAEIKVDYNNWTETLVKGHNYGGVKGNGFGYVTSSQWEYDTKCENYAWKERPNGIQLSCFPEILLTYDRSPLKVLHDYPNKIPLLIVGNLTKGNITIPFCDYNGKCTTNYTKPFDIPKIPKAENQSISKKFDLMMYDKIQHSTKLSDVADSLHLTKNQLFLYLWKSMYYNLDNNCVVTTSEGAVPLNKFCTVLDTSFIFQPYSQQVYVFTDNFKKQYCKIDSKSYYCNLNDTVISFPVDNS